MKSKAHYECKNVKVQGFPTNTRLLAVDCHAMRQEPRKTTSKVPFAHALGLIPSSDPRCYTPVLMFVALTRGGGAFH